MKLFKLLSCLCLGVLLASCASYRQNIMFKAGENTKISREKAVAESNYVIQKNDYLELEVFTNKGERILDPNQELLRDAPASAVQQEKNIQYLIDNSGIARFPLVDEIKLEGLTLRQAELLLQKEYAKNYVEPFVVLKMVSKRVTVLGSPGGKVIPLTNENVRLTEILALAGGINLDGKAHNIRVLRGEQIFIADLSTVEGYLANNLIIQPGDIVYVEPIRRPFLEGLRDYASLTGILVSVATLIVVFTR